MSGSYTYLGLWTNWSHGAVLGSTITLSSRDGGLLISFLAIFVSLAGTAFWRILSFCLHQHLSKKAAQPGSHHQRQVILRNTTSPADAIFQLLQLSWAWRKNEQKSGIRSLPLAVLALLNVFLFGLAGVFSSEVTKAAGNEVLIISPSCGIWFPSNSGTAQAQSDLFVKILDDSKRAYDYARECYDSTTNTLGCHQYIQQRIPWKVEKNASCPFSPEICMGGASSAYEMDTGLIDSHAMLGINTPKSDRLSYRKVTTCSPIHTKDYSTFANISDPTSSLDGDTVEYLEYGSIVGTNYTYMYNLRSESLDLGYSLKSFTTLANTSALGWIPIPALGRMDADVSLFLLAPNSIYYSAPVQDPFFSANIEVTIPADPGRPDGVFYIPDQYVYALACTDQHQLCTGTKCTPLTGFQLAINSSLNLDLNLMQSAIRDRLSTYLLTETIYWSVQGLGSNALRAADTLVEHIQAPLPNDQWTIEVGSWMATSLARLQRLVVEYATGPSVDTNRSLFVPANTTEEKSLCLSQKIRSAAGTSSFSVLGVAIILIVGTFLILLSLTLSTIVGFLRERFGFKDHKRLQWLLDEKLQLHRLAYEEAGQGHWMDCASSVPVTRKYDLLGVPDEVDKEHPRLSRRGTSSDMNPTILESSSLMGGKNPYTVNAASYWPRE